MLAKALVIFILGVDLSLSCHMSQVKHGCRIQHRTCSCGEGCPGEYRYETIQECQAALGGKRDICNPNPCENEGTCLQITQRPGFRCRCEGTGYYGIRCNRACPIPGYGSPGDIFPYECIVI